MIHPKKQQTGGFTVYANGFVRDKALSLEAKGALRYLLSKPDTWCLRRAELQNALCVGRAVVDRIVAELTAAGYLLERAGGARVVLEGPSLANKAEGVETGTIRYSRKERKTGYSITSDEPFTDCRMSPGARGVLCYLLSLPEDWNIQLKAVASACGITQAKVGRLLRELRRTGHVRRVQKKGPDGRVSKWEIEVFEGPEDNPDYSADKPHCGNVANHNVENQQLVITNREQSTEENESSLSLSKPQCTESTGSDDPSDSGLQVGEGVREGFDRIVAAYPKRRRGNLNGAFGEYQEALASGEDIPSVDQLIEILRIMSSGDQWQEQDGKFVPRLRKWISERQWSEIPLEAVPLPPQEIQMDHRVFVPRLRCLLADAMERGLDLVHWARVQSNLPAWFRLFVSGSHPDILSLYYEIYREEREEDPNLETLLRETFPGVLEAVEEYEEGMNVSTGH